jgi:serine phosphatase RsbU (regulator of sigma subunit)
MTPGILFALYIALFLWRLFGGSVDKRLLFFVCCCVPIAVLVVFLKRFTEQQRENVLLSSDMRQAQEVQRVMIPESLTSLPGFVIESEYRPAREVSGDFFQILPNESDGSLPIVVGDVTGKGLKAGMVVALLVGAIRTAAQFDPDPFMLCRALNQRLLGRGNVQATCLVLRIDADGLALLVNAGHLPPYLNGQPIHMDGALPLGLIAEAEPSVKHLQLKPGDRLMLISDGISEATDAKGNLFGFERINDLLSSTSSAADLADAAQHFGQDDDISVVAITRTGAEVHAPV